MDNQPDPVTAPTMGVAPYSPSPLPPVPQPFSTPPAPRPSGGGLPLTRGQFIGLVVAFLVVMVLGLLFLVWLQRVGALHVLRDILVIFLAFESILLLILMGFVLLQLQSVIQYLNGEVRPILNNVQESVSQVTSTSNFVRESVAEPFIEARSTAAGVSQTMRALFRRPSKP